MSIKDIKNAIEVLKSCQYCWADQIADDDKKVSDYDAIEQTIKCLDEWRKNEKDKNF